MINMELIMNNNWSNVPIKKNIKYRNNSLSIYILFKLYSAYFNPEYRLFEEEKEIPNTDYHYLPK